MSALKLTQEQAAFYKDIDVKAAVGDKLYPEFVHKGITVRVLPYETCSADVIPLQDCAPKFENVLAVRNIPETRGLHAEAVLTKVVTSAKAQYKSGAELQHFILRWAGTVPDWAVTAADEAHVTLEACSPDGYMHMMLAELDGSTEVHIRLPKCQVGVQMTIDDPLRRDPVGLSGIVLKALTHLEQSNFTHTNI